MEHHHLIIGKSTNFRLGHFQWLPSFTKGYRGYLHDPCPPPSGQHGKESLRKAVVQLAGENDGGETMGKYRKYMGNYDIFHGRMINTGFFSMDASRL